MTPTDARLHVLNPVGTRIWELCAGTGRTSDQIVDVLLAEYEVVRAVAAEETRAFIDRAIELDLLVADAANPSDS